MPKDYITHYRDALFNTVCPTCKDRVRWSVPGFLDGTKYAECCKNTFIMSNHDVLVEIDTKEKSE